MQEIRHSPSAFATSYSIGCALVRKRCPTDEALVRWSERYPQ